MFIFGFFSTSIPYIILASLYLVGLGVYSGNYIKKKLVKSDHDKNEIVYSPSETHGAFNLKGKAFHFKNTINYFRCNVASKKDLLLYTKRYVGKDISYITNPIVKDIFNPCFFSRPPPAI